MPRFGDDTQGAASSPGNDDRALLTRFTLTEAATVTSMGGYFASSSLAGASVKFLVYSNNSGTPGTRQIVSNAATVPAGGGLVTASASGSLTAADYYVGVVYGGFEPNVSVDDGISGVDTEMANGTLSFASPPTSWPGTDISYDNIRVNVYVEYTAAGGGDNIAGATTLTFTPEGTVTGDGAIAGSSSLTFTPAGNLVGDGAVAGSSALSFTGAGAIGGDGAISGASALSFDATGAITGEGAIAGSASVIFDVTGQLEGTEEGEISGSTSLSFDVTGALTGDGAISGSSTLSFDLAGNVTDGSAPSEPAGGHYWPSKRKKKREVPERMDELAADRRELRALLELSARPAESITPAGADFPPVPIAPERASTATALNSGADVITGGFAAQDPTIIIAAEAAAERERLEARRKALNEARARIRTQAIRLLLETAEELIEDLKQNG